MWVGSLMVWKLDISSIHSVAEGWEFGDIKGRNVLVISHRIIINNTNPAVDRRDPADEITFHLVRKSG